MNYTLIILGIILVLVLYVLYRYITDSKTMVDGKIYLMDNPPPVSMAGLSNPESTRYTYSLWIYVVSIQTSIDIISASGGSYVFKITLDTNGTLKYNLDTSSDNNSKIITSNFPLQKWVCVCLSVDNDVVDSYIDGKLVKSQKLDIQPYSPTSSTNISYGVGDIYIAQFERLPYPIDPQTAWDRYMAGNGGSYISNSFASYGANIILTKDDVDAKKFILF